MNKRTGVITVEKRLFKQFRDTGREIFLRGLISSHAGNISVRIGKAIYITTRASMIGQLKSSDIIKVPLEENNPALLNMASSETPVHMAIYKYTDARAIIHTHPPYATLLSMIKDMLVPVDWEGKCLLNKVPVIALQKNKEAEEKAHIIGRLMKDYKTVLIRGHGSFVRGDTLEEAYMLTSSLEASSFFLYHLKHITTSFPMTRLCHINKKGTEL